MHAVPAGTTTTAVVANIKRNGTFDKMRQMVTQQLTSSGICAQLKDQVQECCDAVPIDTSQRIVGAKKKAVIQQMLASVEKTAVIDALKDQLRAIIHEEGNPECIAAKLREMVEHAVATCGDECSSEAEESAKEETSEEGDVDMQSFLQMMEDKRKTQRMEQRRREEEEKRAEEEQVKAESQSSPLLEKVLEGRSAGLLSPSSSSSSSSSSSASSSSDDSEQSDDADDTPKDPSSRKRLKKWADASHPSKEPGKLASKRSVDREHASVPSKTPPKRGRARSGAKSNATVKAQNSDSEQPKPASGNAKRGTKRAGGTPPAPSTDAPAGPASAAPAEAASGSRRSSRARTKTARMLEAEEQERLIQAKKRQRLEEEQVE